VAARGDGGRLTARLGREAGRPDVRDPDLNRPQSLAA